MLVEFALLIGIIQLSVLVIGLILLILVFLNVVSTVLTDTIQAPHQHLHNANHAHPHVSLVRTPHCQICSPPYKLFNNTCLNICPTGYIPSDSTCVKCNDKCLACSPSPT